MTNSILITGGFGYLGGRIAVKLAETNEFELYLSTQKNITTLPEWIKKGKVVQLDLTSNKDFNEVCKGIDSIVHLAALNEHDSLANPELAFRINALGTLKLLQAAEVAGIKRFIYFSTAHVYGTPLTDTITEQTIPRPNHPYAITHKAAEDFVLAAHDKKILLGIVLRLSNAFGAPAHSGINRWTLVVNDFCLQAATTKKIVLRTSGLQTRDFIPLEDVISAVLHFLNLPSSQCGDGLYNVGGENSIQIIDMAKLISSRCNKVLGFTPEIIVQNLNQKETSGKLIYSIDKLKSTGYKLQGKVDHEIDNTLKFCQRIFGSKVKSSN